jgi:hypothetical protein
MPFIPEAEGGKIKPPNFTQSYTPEQMLEYARCARDPIHFITQHVRIRHPKLGPMPFRLFDYQRNLVRTYLENLRVVGLMSRQSGKSETAAAFLLWWAIFKDKQDILIVSKDHAGAKEIMERIWYGYEELPWYLKPGVVRNQVHRKDLSNGSKIKAFATTKSSGRGQSISILYCDELAYVNPNIATDFWTSLLPMLATGGKCIITSTPNTDEDQFSKIWLNSIPSPLSAKWEDAMSKNVQFVQEERDQYEPIFETEEARARYDKENFMLSNVVKEDDPTFVGFHALWTSVPEDIDRVTGEIKSYRGEKFKQTMLRSGLSEERFLREFDCSFISADPTLISPIRLATLKNGVADPRFVDRHGVRWYEEVFPNTAYAVTLDPSEGVGLDDACIQVWEIPSLRQIAEWNSNELDQVGQTRMLRRILKRIELMQNNFEEHSGTSNVYFSVERNGQGVGIINAIMYEGEDTFPGYFTHGSQTSIHVKSTSILRERPHKWNGLWTSPASKKRYALEFKNMIERGIFIPRSARLVSQLKTFVRTGNQGWTAKAGAKDDVVMSCILMNHLIDELRFQEPDLDDLIRPDLVDEIPDPNNPLFNPLMPSLGKD